MHREDSSDCCIALVFELCTAAQPSLLIFESPSLPLTLHSTQTSSSRLLMSTTSAPAPAAAWVVHKFGGTSLATAECYANSAQIIRALPLSTEAPASNDSAAGASIPLRVCVIVSAMGEVKVGPGSAVAALVRSKRATGAELVGEDKVTNLLIRATEAAARQDDSYLTILAELKRRHVHVVSELLGTETVAENASAGASPASDLRRGVLAALESDFSDLSFILRSVWLSRSFHPDHNWWFGYGEIWSARLMQAYLTLLDRQDALAQQRREALFVDARDIVQLSKKDSTPDYATSEAKLQKWLHSSPERQSARILVVTGYLATTAAGVPTTLGRDGSDYSASIFGALLGARSVTIWTDVDGVYSAAPNMVRAAIVLPRLSYDEASELAYFGAKVLHPKTMTPLVRHNIPVWIRNTFNSNHQGTCIISAAEVARLEKREEEAAATAAIAASAAAATAASSTAVSTSSSPSPAAPVAATAAMVEFGVRGFSEIPNLSLLIVEGTGMIGVPGVCARLFGALRDAGVNVVLVTQAGSEHSICLCVPRAQGTPARDALRREFRDELGEGEIQRVDLVGGSDSEGGVSCLAIVGDGMRSRPGVASRMFQALAQAGVNIVAIAQGSSERNISVLVSSRDAQKGLKAVHEAFLAPGPASVSRSPTPNLTPSVSLENGFPSASASAPSSASSSLFSPFAPLSSSPSPSDLTVLERLFPLPILATLQGLHSRGIVVDRIEFVLPRSSSSPSHLEQQSMSAVLVALARVCRCGAGPSVSAEEIHASVPSGATVRLLATLTIDANQRAEMQIAPIAAAAATAAASLSALVDAEDEQAVFAIYTRGSQGARAAKPIVLSGELMQA